jgi:glycerol kinase
MAGAVVQWWRDGLQLLPPAEERETVGAKVSDATGVPCSSVCWATDALFGTLTLAA